MGTKPSNGIVAAKPAKPKNPEVAERPKRRRFTNEDKLRILREAGACAPGTIGAVLRREGIYSSHLAAWRQARDRGDLDAGALRKRAKMKVDDQATRARIAHLERENRELQQRLARAELILDIQKKAQGLLRMELESPETTESER